MPRACSRRSRPPTARSGICASAAGVEVLATELYGDRALPRDEVLARFTERAGDAATVYDPHDYSAPYASGSADGRRLRRLPVLDGDRGHDRLGRRWRT